MAVGAYYSSTDTYAQTLIETWNGTSWGVAVSPSNTSDYEALNGVSCLSSTGSVSCLAVGSIDGDALAETWDGTTWSIAPISAFDALPPLGGVSCIAGTTDCVAVGSYKGGVWTETWNGASWAGEVGVPVHPNSSIGRISCVAVTSCVVVGDYATSPKKQTSPTRTMIDELTVKKKMTVWAKAKSPNPGKMFNGLNDVACPDVSSCVAVGSQDTATADGTLVLTGGG